MDGFLFTILLFCAFVGLMLFFISCVKGKWSVYLAAITATLSAWFAGLLLDANLHFSPEGFLSFRILFPILAMGLCVLRAVLNNKPD